MLDAIAQVRTDQAAGMAALNARLDKLVSFDVHQAEVRRLDGKIDDLAADRGMDRLRSAEAHKDLDGKIKAVHESLDQRISAEKSARTSTTRWGVGILVSSLPAAIAVVTLLLK